MKVRAPPWTPEQLNYLTRYNLDIQLYWYAGILSMLVVFAAFNGLSRLVSAYFVRRYHTLHPGKAASNRPSASCLPSAVLAAYRKTIYRRNQLVVWLGFANVAQLFVFLSYTAITLAIAFSGAYGHPDYQAHHCARLTYAHLPLLVGLASKELGVIGWMTGFSPSTLNCLHRWMARVVYFLACYHIFGRFYVNLPTIKPFAKHYRYQAWGLAGFVLWTVMGSPLPLPSPRAHCRALTIPPAIFFSGRTIRRRFFKTFLLTHIICFVASVICLALHSPRLGPYLIAAGVVYISDRIFRLASTIYFNLFRSVRRGVGPSVRVEVVSKQAMKIHITTSQKWRPGQHIYLHAPTFEGGGHPFSIASTYLPISHLDDDPAPQSSTMTLVVRVHGGLTAKLYQHVIEGTEALAYSPAEAETLSMPLFPAFTEGPYGHRLLLHRYESVLLVGGGTGVTFPLPLMLDLVRRARNRQLGGAKPLITERVTFVWAIKDAAEIELIGDELREALFYATPGFLDVQIYITRPGGSGSASSSRTNLPHLDVSISTDSQAKEVEVIGAGYVKPYNASQETLAGSTRPSSILDIRLPTLISPPPAPTSRDFSSLHRSSLTPGAAPFPANSSSLSLDSVVLPVLHGRPRIRDILADLIQRTPEAGSVAVGCCAPVPLVYEVGAACSDAIDPRKVLRGEHRVNVMLHAETFGW
ncbi:hypothetical protein JCM8097_007312 [Rhodosporidiobolus ruineniae]